MTISKQSVVKALRESHNGFVRGEGNVNALNKLLDTLDERDEQGKRALETLLLRMFNRGELVLKRSGVGFYKLIALPGAISDDEAEETQQVTIGRNQTRRGSRNVSAAQDAEGNALPARLTSDMVGKLTVTQQEGVKEWTEATRALVLDTLRQGDQRKFSKAELLAIIEQVLVASGESRETLTMGGIPEKLFGGMVRQFGDFKTSGSAQALVYELCAKEEEEERPRLTYQELSRQLLPKLKEARQEAAKQRERADGLEAELAAKAPVTKQQLRQLVDKAKEGERKVAELTEQNSTLTAQNSQQKLDLENLQTEHTRRGRALEAAQGKIGEQSRTIEGQIDTINELTAKLKQQSSDVVEMDPDLEADLREMGIEGV